MLVGSYDAMEFKKKLEKLVDNQSRLARQTGVPQSAISDAIAGKRRLYFNQVVVIAKALNVSLDYLGDDAQNEPAPGLSRHDETILELCRKIGYEVAIERLTLAPVSSPPLGESYDVARKARKPGRKGGRSC